MAARSLIDMMTTVRVGFTGTLWASGGSQDLVEVEWMGDQASFVEVIGARVALADERTLVANEHLGLEILRAYDGDHLGNNVGLGSGSGGDAQGWVTYGFPVQDAAWSQMADLQGDGQLFNTAVLETHEPTAPAGLAYDTLDQDGWNVQIPYRQLWLPEDRPITLMGRWGVNELLVWRVTEAPSSDVTVRGEFTFRYSRITGWD